MRPQVPKGYRVEYRHYRRAPGGVLLVADWQAWALGVSAKGGETEAKVFGPDDSLVAIGIATCHARDTFSRRIGRDIALGRALKRLEEKQLMARSVDG